MSLCKLSAANSYTITGVLFGLAFPLCCMIFLAMVGQVDLSHGLLGAVRQAHNGNVLLYVIDTAPIFLGLFARFAGVRQGRIDDFNKVLQNQVAEKTQSLSNALEDAKRAHQTVSHMAHHDALTGLANRYLFRERLELTIAKADASSQLLALVFIDIDHFKSVNDELGHEVGDALLCEIASRLMNNLNHEDTVARLGGDEFVMVLTNLSSSEHATKHLEILLDKITEPMTLVGREDIAITASLGVSVFPEHGDQADQLISKADQAMYRVKKSGRGAYQLFDA